MSILDYLVFCLLYFLFGGLSDDPRASESTSESHPATEDFDVDLVFRSRIDIGVAVLTAPLVSKHTLRRLPNNLANIKPFFKEWLCRDEKSNGQHCIDRNGK